MARESRNVNENSIEKEKLQILFLPTSVSAWYRYRKVFSFLFFTPQTPDQGLCPGPRWGHSPKSTQVYFLIPKLRVSGLKGKIRGRGEVAGNG